MKEYDLILFDLDGTLTDPESGLIKSFAYALSRMGIDCSDRPSLRRFIGPPLYDEWQRVYGFSPEASGLALDYFHEYYEKDGWCDNVMYEGIPALLSGLRAAGKRIALATSKPEVFAKKILRLFGISQYFDFEAGAYSDRIRDKKWEVLAYALQQFPDIPKDRCVLIGDRKYDSEGARICGIDAIGVLWGHGSKEELSESSFTAVFRSPEDLLTYLV
jgi:phosphoglycolate phosphatase